MWLLWGVLVTLGCVQARTRLDPLVDTNQGLIKGLKADDGDYSKFLGIPYAQVDSNNPFGASILYPKFESVFEAYDDSIACPQSPYDGIRNFDVGLVYSLDCLRLNIYVPNEASSRNKLPVLVNIHGGGFSGGAGNIGAKYLVQHGVVVVSINYRLGPYGFMCLDTPEIPGNQGLKDQYSALEWVQTNIEAFGGDPRKVTVMGGSAGSMSIDFHLLSKRSKLFNRVIMMSGSALNPEEVVPSDSTIPLRLAATLGFETDNLDEALKFLTKTNAELVIAASTELSLYFRPCIEKEFENVEPIITEHPEHVDVSSTKNIAILSGCSSYEELHRFFDKSPEFYKSSNVFHEYLNKQFAFGGDSEMEDIVRHFYVGDEKISEDLKWELIDFASDFQFFYPSQRSLVRYSEKAGLPIYYYVFAYGAGSHGEEQRYLFAYNDESELSEAQKLGIARVTALWTNFVKTGDPTPETTDLLPIKWSPMTKDVMNYMHLQDDLKLENRPKHERTAFWDLFYILNGDKLKANEFTFI